MGVAIVGIMLMVGTLYAGGASDPMRTPVTEAELVALTERADSVRALFDRVEDYYALEVEPVTRVLRRYTDDDGLAREIGVALVREANRVDLEPRLLLAVLLVENPWLDPEIRSHVGAVGLMQVMPVHRGQWGCGGDLEDVDANICHGARIFAHYVERTGGDMERALLRYNGCVRGTNTPDCHRYPDRVLAYADAGMMAWLRRDGGVAGASK